MPGAMAMAYLQTVNQDANAYSDYALGMLWVAKEQDQWILEKEALNHSPAFVVAGNVAGILSLWSRRREMLHHQKY